MDASPIPDPPRVPSLECEQALLDCPAGLACARSASSDEISHGRLLTRLLAHAIQPVVGVDFDGRITCANQAFGDLAGLTAGELVGRAMADLTPQKFREPQTRALARVKSTARSLRFEAELLTLGGRVIPIEVAAEPDRDARGDLSGVYAFVTDLTARAKAEAALRESEERYRRLYDDAPVGYHEVDTDGLILSINRTECEILGYVPEQVVGRSVFELVAEESRDAARQAFPDKVSGKNPLKTIERTVITGDGRRIAASIQERYRRDPEGRIIGLLSTLQDVTEQKRVEAALVASERRARALFEGIEDAVFVHDLEGRILDANPAATRLLGYSHDEFLSLTTQDIDEPSFAQGYADRLADQIRTGHLSCEGRHRTKDGRVLPVEISTSAIQFDDRKAVLAVIRDISERLALEKARQALAEEQERNAHEMAVKNAELTLSESRYRRLTEGSLDGVVAADCAGLITLLNPSAARMFGFDPSEVIGRPIDGLMPLLSAAQGRSFEDEMSRRQPCIVGKTVELVGKRKGGEDIPLELSLNAVEGDGEVQFIASIRDQTERQRMRAMLVQSEKLASIGLLSAGVAHEINNPLAYVANNLAVLERDLTGIVTMVEAYESAHDALESAAPEVVKKVREAADDLDWTYVRDNLPRMLARTREGVQRVASIVANLRWLARTSPMKFEPAKVSDLFESALEMVRVRLRRHRIEVETEYLGEPNLVCVPTQISQVLLNLLINACQAIETSGRTEGGLIRFTTAKDGNSAVLSVCDNGPGIPPEVAPRLFDPFFTTKSIGEGTGLGLSICHGIVSGHGGRIEVASEPGRGACFRLYLPLEPTVP